MLDRMSDSIQGSRIENLQSREVDRQSPTGLIFYMSLLENVKRRVFWILNKRRKIRILEHWCSLAQCIQRDNERQQQSFRPLVSDIVDQLFADHIAAAVHDLFQVVNVVDLLTPYQLPKSFPNWLVHWI